MCARYHQQQPCAVCSALLEITHRTEHTLCEWISLYALSLVLEVFSLLVPLKYSLFSRTQNARQCAVLSALLKINIRSCMSWLSAGLLFLQKLELATREIYIMVDHFWKSRPVASYAGVTEIINWATAWAPFFASGCVQMSSIHNTKILLYPIVFVAKTSAPTHMSGTLWSCQNDLKLQVTCSMSWMSVPCSKMVSSLSMYSSAKTLSVPRL